MNFVADLRFKFCGLPSCWLLTYGYRTEPTTEMWKKRRTGKQKRTCSEVSVNSPGNLWSSQSGRKLITCYDVIPSYDRASCEAMIKQV